jgi:hypothetical protein
MRSALQLYLNGEGEMNQDHKGLNIVNQHHIVFMGKSLLLTAWTERTDKSLVSPVHPDE